MDSKYFVSKKGNKVNDLVVEIQENETDTIEISSRKLRICKICLLLLVSVLFLIDSALISPFSLYKAADLTNTTEAEYNIVPLAFVSLIEISQIFSLIPRCSAVLIFIFRIMQIGGFFGLKILIQNFQTSHAANNPTPGYFGYAILCGFIGSMVATELPKNMSRTSALVYSSLLGMITAIVMGCEFGFNPYQTIGTTDFWIDIGFTCATVLIIIAVYVFISKYGRMASVFKFLCFIIGFIPVMYLLIPTLHFSMLVIRILTVLCGSVVYVVMSTSMMLKT